MRMIVIGNIGSDAGYWSFENGHWVHHGGWEIDQLADISRSLSILGQAARLKTDLTPLGAERAGNKDVTVRVLPGLNHLFQTSQTGSVNEYSQIEETFAPAALTQIGDWIAAHTQKKS